MVSADGTTKTEVQTIYDMAPRPIEFATHSTRVSAGPRGSHTISGEWRVTDGDLTNHAEDTIIQVTDNALSMSDRMGRTFSAKLDGTDAPYHGSHEFTSLSLKVIDKNTIEESDKKDGNIVKISLWSIGPDGKTMHVRFDDTHGHVQEQDGHKLVRSSSIHPHCREGDSCGLRGHMHFAAQIVESAHEPLDGFGAVTAS